MKEAIIKEIRKDDCKVVKNGAKESADAAKKNGTVSIKKRWMSTMLRLPTLLHRDLIYKVKAAMVITTVRADKEIITEEITTIKGSLQEAGYQTGSERGRRSKTGKRNSCTS